MRKKFKKIYSDTIDFPIIPDTGLTGNKSETNYYILLEKSYKPVTSHTESIKSNNNFITESNIKLTPDKDNSAYNRLTITCPENTTSELKAATIEFEVKTPEIHNTLNNTELNIKPNKLYINFKQTPKLDMYAFIQIIDETDNYENKKEQRNNATSDYDAPTYKVNGDSRILKIIYKGVISYIAGYDKNGNAITTENYYINDNVKLYLNNSNNQLDENNENVISKKITYNGIEIKYKLNENLNTDINLSFICSFTNSSDTKTVYAKYNVIQSVNKYETDLMIIKTDNINNITSYKQLKSVEFSDIIDANKHNDLYIAVKCIKNNEDLSTFNTNNLYPVYPEDARLLFTYDNNILKEFDKENNIIYHCIKLNINSNPTNIRRYTIFNVIVNDYIYESNKFIDQNNAILTIEYEFRNIPDYIQEIRSSSECIYKNIPDTFSLNSASYYFYYYIKAQLSNGSFENVIKIENIVGDETITDEITFETEETNFAYSLENLTDKKQFYTIFANNQKTRSIEKIITLKYLNGTIGDEVKLIFNQNKSTTQIITDIDDEHKSTRLIGGLQDKNVIHIYYTNKSGNDYSTKNLSIKFGTHANYITLDKVINHDTYLENIYYLTDDFMNESDNTNSTNYNMVSKKPTITRVFNYVILYNDSIVKSSGIIEQWPVFYGSNISIIDTNSENISSLSGTYNYEAYGIIYNRYNDFDNYTIVAPNLNDVSLEETDYVTYTKYISASKVYGTMSILKNNKGIDRSFQLWLDYKDTANWDKTGKQDINKYLNHFYEKCVQGTLNVNLKLICKEYPDKSEITINPFVNTTLTFIGTFVDETDEFLEIPTSAILQYNTNNYTILYMGGDCEKGTKQFTMSLTLLPNFYLNEQDTYAEFSLTYVNKSLYSKITIIKPQIYTYNSSNQKVNYITFNKCKTEKSNVDKEYSEFTGYVHTVVKYTTGTIDYIDTDTNHYTITYTTSGDLGDSFIRELVEPEIESEQITFIYGVDENIFNTKIDYTFNVQYNFTNTGFSNHCIDSTILQQGPADYKMSAIFYETNTKQCTISGLENLQVPFTITRTINGSLLDDVYYNSVKQYINLIPDISTVNGCDVYIMDDITYSKSLYISKQNISSYEDIINISWTPLTYSTTYTDSLTINSNGLPVDDNLKLYLDIGTGYISSDGEDVLCIYYLEYDGQKFLATDNLTLQVTFDNQVQTIGKSDELSDNTYKNKITIHKNTTTNNKTLQVKVIYTDSNGKSKETHSQRDQYPLILTWNVQSITTFEAYNNTQALLYNISKNGVIDHDKSKFSLIVDNDFISYSNHIENGNYVSTTITVSENETESQKFGQITINYKDGDIESSYDVTIQQKSNSFSCAIDSDTTNIDFSSQNITIKYRGNNISGNVTDTTKVTLKCDNQNVTYTVTSSDSSWIYATATIPENTTSSNVTYTFTASYNNKSVSLIITQELGNITIKIESDLENDIINTKEDTKYQFTLKYWGESDSGVHAIYDERIKLDNILGASYSDSQGTYEMIKDLQVKTGPLQDSTNKYMYVIYTYSKNIGTGGNQEKITKFTALYNDKKENIIIRQTGENQTVLSSFTYMIFNYKLHNDISDLPDDFDTLETSTLEYYNNLAGTDLDTITQIITTDSSAPIYVYDTLGDTKVNDTSAFDFSKITAGYMQTIRSYYTTDSSKQDNALSKYIRFGGDNMDYDGQESIFVNMYAMTKDNDFISKGITKIYCNLYGHWYGRRKTGKVDVTYNTYKTDNNIIDYNNITCENFIIRTTDTPVNTQTYESVMVFDNNVSIGNSTLLSGAYTLLAILTYDIKTGTATLNKIQRPGNAAISYLLYNHKFRSTYDCSNNMYVLTNLTCSSTLNTLTISFRRFAYQKFNPTDGTLGDFTIADNYVWTLDGNKYGDNTKLNAILSNYNQVTINVKQNPGTYKLFCRPAYITFPDVSYVVTNIIIS